MTASLGYGVVGGSKAGELPFLAMRGRLVVLLA